MFPAVLLLVVVAAARAQDEVCYPPLGCFSLLSPWKSVLRPLPAPDSPDVIQVRFYLYTRTEPVKRYYVTLRPDISLEGSDFNASRSNIFITHGFASNGNASWMAEMKDALLKQVDANVFITDWGPGASTVNYLQVASNTRVVASEFSRLVRYLMDMHNVIPASLHLIGHSLGSHISSYVAKNITGVARITALDPAQPAFELYPKEVRLDSSDAVQVLAIHTDAVPIVPTLGFGMIGAVGDVDFYVNGGFKQPGCVVPDPFPDITNLLDLGKIPVEVIANWVACPHSRAYEVFTAALRNDTCTFWGKPSSFVDDALGFVSRGYLNRYLTPTTEDCTIKSCTRIGLDTFDYPARGVFTVSTTSSDPFCIPQPDVDAAMLKKVEQYDKDKSYLDKLSGITLPRVLPKALRLG